MGWSLQKGRHRIYTPGVPCSCPWPVQLWAPSISAHRLQKPHSHQGRADADHPQLRRSFFICPGVGPGVRTRIVPWLSHPAQDTVFSLPSSSRSTHPAQEYLLPSPSMSHLHSPLCRAPGKTLAPLPTQQDHPHAPSMSPAPLVSADQRPEEYSAMAICRWVHSWTGFKWETPESISQLLPLLWFLWKTRALSSCATLSSPFSYPGIPWGAVRKPLGMTATGRPLEPSASAR